MSLAKTCRAKKVTSRTEKLLFSILFGTCVGLASVHAAEQGYLTQTRISVDSGLALSPGAGDSTSAELLNVPGVATVTVGSRQSNEITLLINLTNGTTIDARIPLSSASISGIGESVPVGHTLTFAATNGHDRATLQYTDGRHQSWFAWDGPNGLTDPDSWSSRTVGFAQQGGTGRISSLQIHNGRVTGHLDVTVYGLASNAQSHHVFGDFNVPAN